MGCCGNNPNCKQKFTAFETTDAPIESLLSLKEIAGLLSVMATTGVKNFSFKDATLDNLASKVAELAAENNYLKRLSSLVSPTNAELVDEDIVITFGPASVYTLSIPVPAANQRKILGEQLVKIAEKLGAASSPADKQLCLF